MSRPPFVGVAFGACLPVGRLHRPPSCAFVSAIGKREGYKMGIRRVLRQAGMLPSPVTRQECLGAGFSLAYHQKFAGYPFDTISKLDVSDLPPEIQSLFGAATNTGISLNYNPAVVNARALENHQDTVGKFFKAIGSKCKWKQDVVEASTDARRKLSDITGAHDAWFRIGVFVFHTTEKLGFDLVAYSTEEARKILTRDDVAPLLSNLAAGFSDLNWEPDRIEQFCRDKVHPIMWQPELRKWVHSVDMAIMSDLRHIATEQDKREEPPGVLDRIVPAIKALLNGIPVVGKAAVAILWGEKGR